MIYIIQVINILLPYSNVNKLERGCDVLMKEVLKKWSKESMVDDITFIAILLE